MISEPIIEVSQISKMYTIWSSPAARLHGPLLGQLGQLPFVPASARRFCERRSHESFREFYALRDISFSLKRGESMGIIGRNGCGKSTLLQIIAGTLTPTAGEVHLRGSVAALLELGSGFNPEFTGRENIYMNAAIRGLTKEQTDAKIDEIIAFADIGNFIDQPTKTYSSGMLIRVAFAVSVCVLPDVLIVDEALSVGDVFFQQKCFKRIDEIQEAGTSLLFVSHDTASVQRLCDRAILLKDGQAIFEGPPEEAVSRYYAISSGKAALVAPIKAQPIAPVPAVAQDNRFADLRADILEHDILPTARSRHGAGEMKLVAASFVNECGLHAMTVHMQKTATIHLLLKARQAIAAPSTGIQLYDRMNNLVFAAGTRQLRVPLAAFQPDEERIVSFQLDMTVTPGDYTFTVGCGEPSQDGPNAGYIQDRHEGLGPISVYGDNHSTFPFYGIAQLPMRVSVVP